MFPRFCKLCYQNFDESIIRFRRFSLKQSEVAAESYSSDNDFKEDKEEPQNKPKKVCIIKCKQPQFDFYAGQVYPKFEAIPLASRGWHHRKSKGDYFTIYPYQSIDEEKQADDPLRFEDINLDSRILENLKLNNIINPTEIQKLAIPKILNCENVALTAETGCGKTYAFLIPLLQQILQWKTMISDRGLNSPLGLILTPSKELTFQIAKVAKQLSKNLDINIVKLVGGRTKHMINNPPVGEVDLIVATIGVMSKLISNNIYKLDQVRHIVLDEADTLLDDTFETKVFKFLRKIPLGATTNSFNKFPKIAQITLNSATIPQNLSELLNGVIDTNSIKTVTTGYEHQIHVPQKFYRVGSSEKPMILLKLVKPKVKSKIPLIVFSNTTKTCDFTTIFLKQFGINCASIHKKMPLEERRGKIVEFQNGKYQVLTTTDAGARGLDTIQVKDVINFEFPLITSEYIHRCGRVGRIGSPRDCRVINFISRPLEIVMTAKIEYAARKMKSIPIVDLIHNKYDEEGQFLSGNEAKKNVIKTDYDKDSNDDYDNKDSNDDDDDNDDKEENFSIPQ